MFNGTTQIDDKLKYTTIGTAICFIHICITFIFLYLKIYPLFFYNLFISIFYGILSLLFVPKRKFVQTFYLTLFEVVFHSSFATLLIGWDFGYMMYTSSLVPVSFYLAYTLPEFKKEIKVPLLSSSFVMCSFLLTKLISSSVPVVYLHSASERFTTFIFCSNTIISFLMLIVFSIFFTLEIKYSQTALEKENSALDFIANYDPLTQLLNRRSMEMHLHTSKELAKLRNFSFSIVIADIDDFKKINDLYGHDCGDKVLVDVATILRNNLRENDYACRWGGEEMLLLINSNLTVTEKITERIRREIESSITYHDNIPIKITMTFGIIEYIPGVSIKKQIQMADNKLYVGKNNGKNQVVS